MVEPVFSDSKIFKIEGTLSFVFSCFRGVTDPIYKAIWADNKSFDEVLISKRMVQDHMPDNVLGALEKVS